MSLREPGRNLQIQSTAPLNVSGSHFRTRRAKPQRPLCPDETCMEVTALKDQAETCRHFADRTIAERGVRYGRVATTPTSAKTKRHPKAYLAIETPVVACPFRVTMRRTRIEHMLSAYHPIATDERTSQIGRFVPRRRTSPIHQAIVDASKQTWLTMWVAIGALANIARIVSSSEIRWWLSG